MAFTIQFVNDDDTLLQSVEVEAGAMPEYTGETPTKEETAQYTYEFAGWDPEIVAASEDAIYKATYEATVRQYTVIFEDYDHTAISTENYDYGTPADSIVPSENPYREPDEAGAYVFTGWDPEVAEVTEDATYTAQYYCEAALYRIRFFDSVGNLMEEKMVAYGETPSYGDGSDPVADGCEFTGWNPAIADVTEDADYVAEFEKKIEIIKEDDSMGPDRRRGLFLTPGQTELDYIPTWAAAGSIAVSVDENDGDTIWVKNMDGDWVESTGNAAVLLGF